MSDDPVRAGYDAVAEDYAREIGGELAHKPLDRALLAMAAELAAGGRLGDLGCGPGHVAAHLAGLGADVVGVDLSDRMVAVARARVPEAEFVQGDLRRLPLADGALAGAEALYSGSHLPPGDLPAAAREMARVVRPGGQVLVAFHRGEEVRHLDTWWGHDVSIDFRFLDPDAVAGHLRDAGMEIVARVDRAPIPDAESPTERTYLVARVPAA